VPFFLPLSPSSSFISPLSSSPPLLPPPLLLSFLYLLTPQKVNPSSVPFYKEAPLVVCFKRSDKAYDPEALAVGGGGRKEEGVGVSVKVEEHVGGPVVPQTGLLYIPKFSGMYSPILFPLSSSLFLSLPPLSPLPSPLPSPILPSPLPFPY
jgi:hypothetical protein